MDAADQPACQWTIFTNKRADARGRLLLLVIVAHRRRLVWDIENRQVKCAHKLRQLSKHRFYSSCTQVVLGTFWERRTDWGGIQCLIHFISAWLSSSILLNCEIIIGQLENLSLCDVTRIIWQLQSCIFKAVADKRGFRCCPASFCVYVVVWMSAFSPPIFCFWMLPVLSLLHIHANNISFLSPHFIFTSCSICHPQTCCKSMCVIIL